MKPGLARRKNASLNGSTVIQSVQDMKRSAVPEYLSRESGFYLPANSKVGLEALPRSYSLEVERVR